MKNWTEAEIWTYLTFIIGRAPQRDAEGNVKIPGPSGFCHQRGHQAVMDARTGSWRCPNCASGDLDEYEFRRSPDRNLVAVRHAIEETIRIEQDKALERAQQAEHLIPRLALPSPTASLLRKIYCSPGITRRLLQQRSHMTHTKFNTAIRCLERAGHILHRDTSSTGGRVCRAYFPASAGAPPDTTG